MSFSPLSELFILFFFYSFLALTYGVTSSLSQLEADHHTGFCGYALVFAGILYRSNELSFGSYPVIFSSLRGNRSYIIANSIKT